MTSRQGGKGESLQSGDGRQQTKIKTFPSVIKSSRKKQTR